MNVINFHQWYENRLYLALMHQSEPKRTWKYEPPQIEPDQLEYMAFLLEEAHELEKPVLVTYAGKHSPLQFYGQVIHVQPYEGWFIMANGQIKQRLRFRQLIEVDWF
ncbi:MULTISPECIES: YolD-like family protein [unclassified Thermoactinomyces]|uniref:YolD-like family protein n=1 Tax=unclassified Thermoactinomyces TaxID=2634588 RepID=UPI0018DB06F9|nr:MULTISPECIES: YolD-like family protein [unclassified Thermoactinomyces]MBH8598676.1 YolD-like family protein [Thermoactinomyces sp. CICC 10523]MBH8605065.1 YolD-like family protein [Thermoactinomyces sp. CICC 10522]